MHGLSVLITAFVKHRYLGKLQVYMFCRKVVGIHKQDFKKMWRCLHQNQTVFTGTFDHLDFPAKPVTHVKVGRFSLKNRKIAGKVFNFFRKILYFLEKLPIYAGKFNRFYRKMWRFLLTNISLDRNIWQFIFSLTLWNS